MRRLGTAVGTRCLLFFTVSILSIIIAVEGSEPLASAVAVARSNCRPLSFVASRCLIRRIRSSSWTVAVLRNDPTVAGLYQQPQRFLTNRSKLSNFLHSSSTEDMQNGDIAESSNTTMRILALHGSGGSGSSLMESTMNPWIENMKEKQKLEVVAVDGHVPMEDGFSWWKLGPGERSFTADHYDGFEMSREIFMKALSTTDESRTNFDVIFGHSQGAIFLTALLALQEMPYHPRIGYILNGVAWPNPYSLELESLSVSQPPPRILVLSGERDYINPPAQAQRVVTALERAGCAVTVVTHPGGHAVPTQFDTPTWEAIHQWMLEE